jgi:TonB family protein
MRSSVAVFAVALLASLGIHLPIYEVLGKLADVLLREPAETRTTTVELELAPLVDTPPKPAEDAKAVLEPKPESKPEPERKDELPPEPKVQAQEQVVQRPTPKPEEKKEPEPTMPVPAVPVPVPPQAENPLAVTQQTDDPAVEAPENPRFIAEDNRRVEQETVARVRNMHRDDPDPSASARPSKEQSEVGDAEEQEVADLQDLEGSDERTPDRTEAEHRPEVASQPSMGEREAHAVSSPAPGSPAPSTEVAPQRASGATETGGEPETIVVHDGSGSFTIRRTPAGRGPGEKGGDEQAGMPSNQRSDREGSREQNGRGTNLRVTWSQFESTFGEDQLREQRETYLAQRRSQARGGQERKQMWRKFRAAIENFVPNVQPGEQTALNTAASPFAAYLAEVHRRIHREFAHRFLASLPIAGGPFGDRSLNAMLEIVINGDGTLHQVGIAQTSGFLPFDYGAFNAVTRAAPYPQPPRKILSGDGRVYVHWGFFRNERQCGTFNARPFILPHPGGTPAPGRGPLEDQGAADPPPDREPFIYNPREGELGGLHGDPRRPHDHAR